MSGRTFWLVRGGFWHWHLLPGVRHPQGKTASPEVLTSDSP